MEVLAFIASIMALAYAVVLYQKLLAAPKCTDRANEIAAAIAPERLFECYPPQRPIDLDGSLGEWDALALVADPPAVIDHANLVDGRDDGSFRFDVRCSDEYLYVGVGVRDDSVVASPEKIGREQDGVSLWLDSRADPARSGGGLHSPP